MNLLRLSQDEETTAILPIREFELDKYIVMATKKGVLKKTQLSAYSRPRSSGIIALNLDDGDELVSVGQTNGNQEIFIGTQNGKS